MICRKVGGNYFSLADPYLRCDGDYFAYPVLPFNLLMIFLMGILIPVVLLLKLRQKYKNKKLNNTNNMRIYGFFYNELKLSSFYWDFILMAVKINVAFISTFYYET